MGETNKELAEKARVELARVLLTLQCESESSGVMASEVADLAKAAKDLSDTLATLTSLVSVDESREAIERFAKRLENEATTIPAGSSVVPGGVS